jgi:hypothetical protein
MEKQAYVRLNDYVDRNIWKVIGQGLIRCKTNVSLTSEVYNTRHEYRDTCIRPADRIFTFNGKVLLSAHNDQLTDDGTVQSHLLVGCRPYLPTYNKLTEYTPFKA